jgi:hypothetical protein
MFNRTAIGKTIVVLGLAASACSQSAPPAPPPAPPPVGRYQIATIAEGDRGTTLILLDTSTGESWYFHQPVGQLFNGFWGNVPKAVTPDSTWSQAFQSVFQSSATNQPAR